MDGLPGGHPPVEGLPAGHPPLDGTGVAVGGDLPGVPKDAQDNLRWIAPDGWKRAADKPMRLVTYVTGESGQTECFVSVLSGDGGGLASNINRWRQQMGQAALSDAELEALPRIDMMGQQAVLVEIPGDYTGMTGPTQPGFMMRGLVCMLPGQSLYVKMTGPEAEVAPERDRFVRFAQSIHAAAPGE